MPISHRERIETILDGQKPDRPAVALWHHFPVDDQNPFILAKATQAYQERFDFDLIKTMPTSSFCLKDWGSDDVWRGNTEGTRDYIKRVVTHPDNWEQLNVLDPEKGHLGQQLQCLALLQETYSGHTPILQTIFNPLSQAKNLVGSKALLEHIRLYPDALHHGLATIQDTTLQFIESAKKFGIAGIFYAIQHASYLELTENEYKEFGVAYDLPLINAVNDLWANMVHIHGEAIMFDLIADYPVQILNWHDRETAPLLGDGLKRFRGTVCGGISRFSGLGLGTPKQIRDEAVDALEQTNGKHLILGTGCVLPLTTPYGNIMTLRNFVEEIT